MSVDHISSPERHSRPAVALTPMPWGSVRLTDSLFQHRANLVRRYLLSLSSDNILQNHYMEAGLWNPRGKPENCHWGWESPTCQVRGQFLGHWLAAAARFAATNDDPELKGKADHIVSELARCQRENGGEWIGSIPTKYLDWLARGKSVWAPQYVVQKTMMGLYEMATLTGNEQALDVLERSARWFHRWTGRFSRQEFDDMLDTETGAMLELWSNLYGLTGKQEHLDLVYRYDRPRLFDPFLAGEDVLTNRHANTTIPEAHGTARAWEVTGDARWRAIAEAYWRQAVTERGYFCTGGQTIGEMWTAPFQLAGRLGETNQEHCTVFNMMRLADWLHRWTGDAEYADYWERNLYNGILAQQHPDTGMVAYFLPLRSGSRKVWGTPTDDFWCCHGTMVEAHTMTVRSIYFEDVEGLVVSQYIPSTLEWQHNGVRVHVTQTEDHERGYGPPRGMAIDLTIACDAIVEFTLSFRIPWWIKADPVIEIDGERQQGSFTPSSLHRIHRTWSENRVSIQLPRGLNTVPLPDEPSRTAFMDGPVVLAGLSGRTARLHGDRDDPDAILAPDAVRDSREWEMSYKARVKDRDIRFVPLHEIRDGVYSVYFPTAP